MAKLLRKSGKSWPFYDLQHQINQLFDEDFFTQGNEITLSTDWIPSMDVKEEKDKFILCFDVPGVELKDMSIIYENGCLTLKGEKETKVEEESEGFMRMERSKGSFLRQISLPDVDPDKIKAKCTNGVLEVKAWKLNKGKGGAKKIEIQS